MNNNLTETCEEQQEDVAYIAFWFEGVVEIIICIVGLVANSVAVPLLTRFSYITFDLYYQSKYREVNEK